MSRLSYIALATATCLIAAVAFAAGRSSRGTWKSERPVAAGLPDRASHPASDKASAPHAEDLAKATIVNIGQVEFDQGYRLLLSASPETLAQWVARLEAMPTSPRKTAGIASFFRILAQVDAKAAVALALTIKGREARGAATGAVFGAIPEANVTELIRIGMASEEPWTDWGSLVDRWSLTDPVSASRFAKEHIAQVDAFWLGSMLENWAAVDPGAAKVWLDQLDSTERKPEVIAGFYSGWFDRDREAALNELVKYSSDEQFRAILDKVAVTAFKESPEAARAVVLRFPEADQQKAVVSSVLGPVNAIYLSGKQPYSEESVAKWLVTLPEEIANDHLGYLVSRWNYQSPDAVSEWLRVVPTQLHDRVEAQFCMALDLAAPQENLKAGLAIVDRQLRMESLRAALQKFKTPESAREAAQKANLPPQQLAELEALIPKDR